MSTFVAARDLRPFDELVEDRDAPRIVVAVAHGAPVPGQIPAIDRERPGVHAYVAPRNLYELSQRIDPETHEPLYRGPIYDAETLMFDYHDQVEVWRD